MYHGITYADEAILEEDKNKMQMRLTKLENTLIYKLYAKFIRKMLNKNY